MQEHKKPNFLVIAFLLIIVVVSGLVMISLYKSQSGQVGRITTVTK